MTEQRTLDPARLDIRSPEGRLHAYVKLRGSLDGSSVAWWYRGMQYGVVDLRPKRLWAVQGLQVTSFTPREDGSFENRFRDLMLYQDPTTGERIIKYENPYTGQMIEPGVQRMGPLFMIYSRAGAAIKDMENVPPGLETDWRVDRAIVNGDDLILHEEGYSRVSGGPLPVIINDFITLQGSLADAANPDLVNAPARYTYTSILTWLPFMNMGDHEGHLMGRGNARKLRSRAELEPAFLDAVLAEAPDWLDGVDLPAE